MIDGNLHRILVKKWVNDEEYNAIEGRIRQDAEDWKNVEIPILTGGADEELDNYLYVKKMVTEAKQFMFCSKEEAK